ncbi:MAG TPA: hypothetical protein VEC57_15330 [Candidatus Limnocylindrales bacterium]|nr:hypothetical protein [Candidatus Limnocylindrales bacterium]
MTQARARNLLWLALLLAAPVPFFLVVVGHVPVARLLQLLALTLTFIAVEGPAGALRTVVLLLVLQIALWAGVLRLVASLAAAAMQRAFGSAGLAAATMTAALLLVAAAATFPLYRTPFRSASLHATLLEVFE